jgi:hypothetical protein
MSRLFLGEKELRFFNSITKELLQKIVEQRIVYYSVSDEYTQSHRVYDESIKKTVFTPVDINALVLYAEPEQTTNEFSIDTIFRVEVYFHIHELIERNITPREGDFIKFAEKVYEIEKLTRPQITYGQIEHEVMVKGICRIARKSQIEILDNLKGI